MVRRPPATTRSDILFPYTTRFLSNMWELARPLIEQWVDEHMTPEARTAEAVGEGMRVIERLPALVAGMGESVERLRSEEHTFELQSLMRNSYAVFRLTKKLMMTQ